MAGKAVIVQRGTAHWTLSGRVGGIVYDLVQAAPDIDALYAGEVTIHVKPGGKCSLRVSKSRPVVYESEFTDDGNPPHG